MWNQKLKYTNFQHFQTRASNNKRTFLEVYGWLYESQTNKNRRTEKEDKNIEKKTRVHLIAKKISGKDKAQTTYIILRMGSIKQKGVSDVPRSCEKV